MVDLLTAMGLVVAGWLILAGAAGGWGLLFLRLAGRRPAAPLSVGQALLAYWSGIALLVMLGQFWHFLSPLDGRAATALGLMGWIGLLLHLRPAVDLFRRAATAHPLALISALLMVLWLANRAIGPCDLGDSGLYHFPILRWYEEFPLVTGLGNLAPAYAMNNASLLLVALADVGPMDGRGHHVVNSLLLAALFLQVIRAGALLWRDGAAAEPGTLVDLLLPAPLLLYALGREASTPSTDVPVGAAVVVLGSVFFRFLKSPGLDSARSLPVLALLSALAVTFKLSSIVFAGVVMLVALGLFLRRPAEASTGKVRPVATAVALGLLLVGPWIARNVVQSGYPLYPSVAAGQNVQWRVPEEKVDFLLNAIVLHAKGGLQLWLSEELAAGPLGWYARWLKPPFATRDEISGFNWAPTWALVQPITGPVEIVLPALWALLGLLLAMLLRARGALKAGRGGWMAWLIPIGAAVVFWFLQSPDRRYVWGPMWLLPGMLLEDLRGRVSAERAKKLVRLGVVLTVISCLAAIGYRAGMLAVLRKTNPLSQIPFLPPGPAGGFYPVPQSRLAPWRSAHGTLVFIPEDQTALVWRARLPAAAWPPPDRHLRLRNEGDLSSGFIIEE